MIKLKKSVLVLLVAIMTFSLSSVVFANNYIDGEIVDDFSKIKSIERTTDELGNEEFIVDFELTPLNNENNNRGVGTASAHFSRDGAITNRWKCYFTVKLYEPIVNIDAELNWNDGGTHYYNNSDFEGIGTKTAVSNYRYNTFLRAGSYRPTCYMQVWGASGPYGTIAVPSINTIVILLDLDY